MKTLISLVFFFSFVSAQGINVLTRAGGKMVWICPQYVRGDSLYIPAGGGSTDSTIFITKTNQDSVKSARIATWQAKSMTFADSVWWNAKMALKLNVADTSLFNSKTLTTAQLASKQNTITNLADTSKYLENGDNVSFGTITTTGTTTIASKPNLHLGANNRLYKSTDTASGGSGFTYVKRTADTSNSAVALVNLGGMNFSVTSGTNYYFKFVLCYSSAALTTGLRTALTTPAFTNFSAGVIHFGQAVDGVAAAWHGTINTSGDVVVSTAVAVINVNYTAVIEGRILPSANGTIWLQIGSEIAASAITIRNGSFLMWQAY